MCRIIDSFVAQTRGNRIAIALACGAAAGALLLSATVGHAGNVSDDAATNPALRFDIGCAQRDLELFTMIERNGNNGLSTVPTLIETWELLQTARSACAIGDVDNALALYDTAIRELENPSDVARR